MGRLTKDPDLRYTSGNNTAVVSFALAVNRRVTQKDGGQPQADFINIVAWNKTAEFVQKYFAKGMQVAVVGRLQSRTWDDNEGKRHYVTEVVADETYFADSKKNGNSEGGVAPRTYSGGSPAPSGDGFYPMDEDDELPF